MEKKQTKPRKTNVTLEIKRYKEIIDKLSREKIITEEEYTELKKIHQKSILRWIGLDINEIEVNV